MKYFVQPDPELTEHEKLLAALAKVCHHIPSGFQLGMPMHLKRAIAMVEELFAAHDLPMREVLVSELTQWEGHAKDGLKFAKQCDQILETVVRTVADSRGS